MYSRGFFSRIALHYGINRNHGEGRLHAFAHALRIVRKTHWPIPTEDLQWRQWPDEDYPR